MSSLKEKFGAKLKINEIMSGHTTFKIGGPAKYFLAVESSEKLVQAIKTAKSENLKYAIIGSGSNLLVSDLGFDGLVIKMLDVRCKISDGRHILAGSGLSLGQLSKTAGDNELMGLEWARGMPGTVGGAIVMNAGCFGWETKDNVAKVKYFDGVGVKELDNIDCQFGYRDSIFQKHPEWIVLEADLKLEKGDKEEIKKKTQEYLNKRNEHLPQEPSAGSIFKKYKISKDEKLRDELVKIIEKERPEFLQGDYIPSGWLIEQAGLKGKTIGRAQVSEKHANFIVNLGGATAENVIMLIAVIKEKIRNEFGINLQEEVMYLGL